MARMHLRRRWRAGAALGGAALLGVALLATLDVPGASASTSPASASSASTSSASASPAGTPLAPSAAGAAPSAPPSAPPTSAAQTAPSWLVAKRAALAHFTPPPPATVELSPAGTGTLTGTAYHAESLHAVVHVGPARATACTIVGELLVPDAATATHREPAVMVTNGFGGAWTTSTALSYAEMAVADGYVALTYSGLGFGGSGCQIELDSPTWDGLAASELISWLGQVPEVAKTAAYPDDPIVGMIGESYGGGVQFSTAAIDPRLDAIVPLITWNDLAYSLAPNNETDGTTGPARRTTTAGVLKWEWTTLFFGDGMAQPLEHPTQAKPSTCPNFAPTVCMAYLTSVALGYPDRATITLLRHDSMVAFYQRLHLPVLLAQGEDDTLFNVREAVANAQELRANGDPVTLVLQSWGHSHSTPAPGELSFSPPFNGYENVLIGDFFAKWLRGADVSTGAPVQYFRSWVPYSGNAAPAYGSASAWPVAPATDEYLSDPATGGTLVTARSEVVAGSQTFVNPPGGTATSYSETSELQGDAPFSTVPPLDAPGTFASWLSAPLAAPTDVVGVPSVTVTLGSSVPAGVTTATDPVVFAKLYGVAPTGAVTLVDRLVSPARVADTAAPVTIDLPGIVHQFPAGDRLELVLSSGDLAYQGNRVADTYTVTVSPAQPGVLRIPIVAASNEQVGPAPTGE